MGMQQIEMQFGELLARINMEFEAKAMEFERTSRQIGDNHAFLTNWYKEMQTKLNEKND
jgi:hypothetical protein